MEAGSYGAVHKLRRGRRYHGYRGEETLDSRREIVGVCPDTWYLGLCSVPVRGTERYTRPRREAEKDGTAFGVSGLCSLGPG